MGYFILAFLFYLFQVKKKKKLCNNMKKTKNNSTN